MNKSLLHELTSASRAMGSLTFALGCLIAAASPIPGLFNTGVNDSGALLVSGSVDPHYRLTTSADAAFPGPNAFVINDSGFPIPPWIANGPNSKWVGPVANQSTGNQSGDYVYRLTFDLTGLDPATAVITGTWTSDNLGSGILLNGLSTGFSNDGQFSAFVNTFTITNGFVDGTNTLDFIVNNTPPSVSPTGLRVEVSGTADLPAPPGTPPSILIPPSSQTNAPGETVRFTVTARGARPLSYQWRHDSNSIPGANQTSFTIDSLSPQDVGRYDVVVTNQWGSVTSAPPAILSLSIPSPAQLTYEAPGPSSRRTGLAITEIMYHPLERADGKRLEFIELYNSNPFPEDLSGYRLTGEWDFTFTNGTTIPGLGYLVIAPAPADVQTVYGLNGVLGGFTNNLPNDKGSIRLCKRSGGVVLRIDYSDEPPWPIAADGSGHSLVLARPSWGENNPKAWAASANIGGSPGAPDPSPASLLEGVVINELLSQSDSPEGGFIELYNHSPLAADISGCVLTDDPGVPKLVIPTNTIVSAGGFSHFRQGTLGFTLPMTGGRVFLINPAHNRVLDAVQFGGQEKNISMGRYPDGGEQWYRLSTNTPGLPNASVLVDQVVINELMYHPISGNDDDQFVELYNRGSTSIHLGGWQLAGGISFTFPTNVILAPDGYLVVARNIARLITNYPNLNVSNTLGNFSGKLAHSGELVVLAKSGMYILTNSLGQRLTNNYAVPVKEFTYATGGRWGRWADGGGSSLELIDPGSNPRLAANWVDSDETAKSTWTAVEASGLLDLGHPSVPSAEQLQILLLGPGEALLDNVQVFDSTGSNRVTNSDFERGNTGWYFQGTHRLSSVQTYGGYGSASALHLRASEKGNQMVDRIRTRLTSALFPGQTATIRAKARWLCGWPEVLLRLKGGYLEAYGRLNVPSNLGTPGLRNSRARSNAGPAIYDVSHRPVLPQANQPVRVTARIEDSDGVGTVRLNYRLDPASTLSSVIMTDDGANGDTLAGDGVYTGMIPGQAAGTLIAFHIAAADANASPATNRFPADAPGRECLVRVGETVPTGAFGTYRFWITAATLNFWSSREAMSSENLDATFVYGNRIFYNVGARYGGSIYSAGGYNSPTGNLCRYDLDFPVDDALLGETRIMLDWPVRDDTAQREQLMYWFLEQYGLPNNYRRYIHLFVNGVARGTIYEDGQKPGGDPVEEWFPDDPDGHLFKTDVWDEFDDAGARIGSLILLNSLENFTTTGGVKKTARYRWNWEPRAVRGTASNFDPLFSLVDAANVQGNTYRSAVEGLVDVEHWMKTFCMNDLASYWDGFGNPNGKNTYLYKPDKDRWKLMCYDFDVGLGVMNDPVDAPLFPSLDDPVMVRLQAFPAFQRHYWRALDRALSSFFRTGAGTAIDALLDAKYAAFQTNGVSLSSPAGVKSWIQQRRAFLQAQLATVSANFSISTPPTSVTNFNVVTLTGTAPVMVKTIAVNGVAYPASWGSLTSWRIAVPLVPGTNVLNVQCFDEFGGLISGASAVLAIQFIGSASLPEDSIVINEIMFAPLMPDASYVELYNRSANYSFNLSGWRFNGLDFIFPQGSIITNHQYLLLAKDPAAFGAAYGWNIPVAGIFAGNLQTNGETLTLLRPVTNSSEVVVTKVRYQPDPPWPSGFRAPGASVQLIDSGQDNWRVGNWSVASTNAVPPPDAQWVYVTATGTASTTPRLYIYLESAGDIYVDDMQLVQGSVPDSGANLLANGNFEAPLSGTWNLTGNFNQSTTSTAQKHTGNSSLHVVATGAGTGGGNAIYQDAALTSGQTYTVSFWYLQTTNGGPLTVRLSGSGLTTGSVDVSPPSVPAVPAAATPGGTNSIGRVLPPFPPLYINEVQAENLAGITNVAGQHMPWLELFNPSTKSVSLDGLFLANQYTNLLAWAFPTGIVLKAREFKIVFADGRFDLSTTNEPHTSFTLSPTAGSLALSRSYNTQPQVLDFLNYTSLPANRSFGSTPDGQSFDRQVFFFTTPGTTNNAASAALPVVINEWMASNTNTIRNPVTGKFDDWFELYNYSTNTVELGGYYLTDSLTNQFKFLIPPGYSIPPKGFLLVWADNKDTNGTPDLHVTWKMDKAGESLGLCGVDGRAVDYVNYGPQIPDRSQGRYPDGSFSLSLLPFPTPGTNNVPPNTAPVLVNPGDHFIYLGQTLAFFAQALDFEVPPQTLTYSLDASAPADAVLNPSSGFFTWTPAVTQLPNSNAITIHVTDNGTPPLSGSALFAVVVLPPPFMEAVKLDPQTLTLRWSSVPGQRYGLEYTEDLSAPGWLPLGTEQVGTGGPLSWEADLSSLVPRFYRLVIIH